MSRFLHRRLLLALAAWHCLLALAAWLSPQPPLRQYRDFPSAPPTPIHIQTADGRLSWPYVCALTPHPIDFGVYLEDCQQQFGLRLLTLRPDGQLALLQSEGPERFFLLGTDEFGRDIFSRMLAGGLLSVGTGLGATLVALALASVAGGVAGFYGGFADSALSRTAELLMAAPLLYLLLAVRAALPIQMDPVHAFWIAIAMVSLVGWTRPARLVRGVVLSARTRGYVLASRGFGAGPSHLLRRHILPEALPVLWTQAALLAPQFVLLEVTLGFLGLGLPEPSPSWGSMMASLRQYDTLTSRWWMWSPAVALTISLLLFSGYAQSLEEAAGEQEPTEGTQWDATYSEMEGVTKRQ
ncbi:MAG: ABC transporter permease [Anaerolineae bacterium]|jgi:peptide/nickel transport system permease protein|nr:ABC transporter permease [Anaerolineae bacterium]